MIPPPASGLVEVVRRVRTYLTSYAITTPVAFGWKERARAGNNGTTPKTGGNRIVVVPSDPTTGKAGAIDLVTSPGKRPVTDVNGVVVGHVRSLREWHRTFTVYVWASSGSDSEEEIVEQTETLFEWVVRAFEAVAGHNVAWGEPSWTVTPRELTNGRELVIPATLHTPIFGVPTEVARPTGVVSKEFTQPDPPA